MKLIPQQKKNDIVTIYRHWVPEKHPLYKVRLISFHDFWSGRICKTTGVHRPFYSAKEHINVPTNVRFIAERWYCQRIDTGEIILAKIKQEIALDETAKEHTLTENAHPIHDVFEPNLLLDTLEEYQKGTVMKHKYPNLHVANEQAKLAQRIYAIKQILSIEDNTNKKQGLFLLLRHKQSPTINTFNTLQKWKQKNQDIYKQLITEINDKLLDI